MKSVLKALRPVLPLALYMAVAAVGCFAQGPFSQAAQGASVEVIATVKWLAVIFIAICGTSLMMNHEHHGVGKVVGVVIGGIVALFATPIVNWIQGL